MTFDDGYEIIGYFLFSNDLYPIHNRSSFVEILQFKMYLGPI